LHVTHAALRPVVEDDDAARLEPDVPLLHRGESVRAAVGGVVLSADPEEAAIQEPHSSRQHPLAVESAPPQVARGDRAHARQSAGEVQHLVELLLRAAFQPALVIAVLPTAGVVGSDRLQVAEGVGADPDVVPAGRHGERANSLQGLLVLHRLTGRRVDVLEAAPARNARDSGLRAIRTTKAGQASAGLLQPGAERVLDVRAATRLFEPGADALVLDHEERGQPLDPKPLGQIRPLARVDVEDVEVLEVAASLENLGEEPFGPARTTRLTRVEEHESGFAL
jgi:hypothetical protein